MGGPWQLARPLGQGTQAGCEGLRPSSLGPSFLAPAAVLSMPAGLGLTAGPGAPSSLDVPPRMSSPLHLHTSSPSCHPPGASGDPHVRAPGQAPSPARGDGQWP